MAPKTIKTLIANTLENLTQLDLEKFRSQLRDRREEPRIPRSKVDDKSFLVVTDVLVQTFRESGALTVTLQILRDINCNDDADTLESDAISNGHIPQPSSGDSGRADVSSAEHFVDRHKVQLIQRVSNVGPVLDELLQKKVIQQESYDKIRAMPTSQEKMRELYCGALRASPACKDIFYKILEEYELYLIEDLRRMK